MLKEFRFLASALGLIWGPAVLHSTSPCLFAQAPDKMVPLAQVSAPGDGTMVGVSPSGEVYGYSNAQWVRLQGQMKQVSAGSAGEIWAVDASNNVFKLANSGWQRMPGSLKQVAAAKGGGAVMGLHPSGNLLRWNGANWGRSTALPPLLRSQLAPPARSTESLPITRFTARRHPPTLTNG